MTRVNHIYVVSDDPALCESIAELLQPLATPVKKFCDADAFLENVGVTMSGCLIVDLDTRGETTLELLEYVKRARYPLRSIVVGLLLDVPTAVRAVRAGATHVLEMPFDPNELIEGVKTELATAQPALPAPDVPEQIEWRLQQLTPEERGVLEGLVMGRTNAEIAARADVSLRTAQSRRAAVLAKMGVKSRAELVEAVLANGWSPTSR